MADQCLWHRRIHRIHGHMISVVSRPAECQLRQIACADDHTTGLICNVHKNLGSLTCLSILVSHIVHFRILSDIPEMDIDRILDTDFHKIRIETFDEAHRIIVSTIRCSESRHCHSLNIFMIHAEQIKCTHRHKQCQCRIQSTGDTDHGRFAVCVLQTFFQSHRLNG